MPSTYDNNLNPAKIRIVYFITSMESGGSERQLANLLSLLSSDEYEKHIICLSGYGILEERFRACCHKVYDLKYPRLRENGKFQWKRIPGVVKSFLALVKYLKQIKPDILHTFIPVCNVMGAFAGKLSSVKIIVSSRLSLGKYRDHNKIFALLEDFSDRFFTLIHCKSEGIKTDIATREPINYDRIRVIYNGIDLSKFSKNVDKEVIRNQLGVYQGDLVIGIIANLKPYKGHADLIEALPRIVSVFPKVKLVAIGRDDGIAKELTKQAKTLGVEDAVILTGEKDNVSDLIHVFTLLVSASHEEGFSNVILEAMAAGLPVVATDVGGNPEAVNDQITGLLVPPKNPAALAAAINQILNNPTEGKLMGIRGRQRVEDLFSNEAMVQKTKAFYREAIALSE